SPSQPARSEALLLDDDWPQFMAETAAGSPWRQHSTRAKLREPSDFVLWRPQAPRWRRRIRAPVALRPRFAIYLAPLTNQGALPDMLWKSGIPNVLPRRELAGSKNIRKHRGTRRQYRITSSDARSGEI